MTRSNAKAHAKRQVRREQLPAHRLEALLGNPTVNDIQAQAREAHFAERRAVLAQGLPIGKKP